LQSLQFGHLHCLQVRGRAPLSMALGTMDPDCSLCRLGIFVVFEFAKGPLCLWRWQPWTLVAVFAVSASSLYSCSRKGISVYGIGSHGPGLQSLQPWHHHCVRARRWASLSMVVQAMDPGYSPCSLGIIVVFVFVETYCVSQQQPSGPFATVRTHPPCRPSHGREGDVDKGPCDPVGIVSS